MRNSTWGHGFVTVCLCVFVGVYVWNVPFVHRSGNFDSLPQRITASESPSHATREYWSED